MVGPLLCATRDVRLGEVRQVGGMGKLLPIAMPATWGMLISVMILLRATSWARFVGGERLTVVTGLGEFCRPRIRHGHGQRRALAGKNDGHAGDADVALHRLHDVRGLNDAARSGLRSPALASVNT